jgi:two-component system, sensor histidine kinase and response regulator
MSGMRFVLTSRLSNSQTVERLAMDDFASVAPRPSLRVLLVEDDEIDARIVVLFAGMSEKFNFELTHVKDIPHAWEALKSESFDLCLMDYWVGDQTSLRLLTSLARSGSHIATVVLSNISPRDVETFRIPCGGAAFLSKGDCSPKNLENAVQAALQSRHCSHA